MNEEKERRRHRRLPLKLEVFCQKVGAESCGLLRAEAVNIAPGGVLLQSSQLAEASEGDLFSLELEIPASDDNLEFGGRFSGFARVVRAIEQSRERDRFCPTLKKHIALEFCARPKLDL
ncbi:MAG: hypothetical protein K8R02_03850 [Anaerohalosphaeraceae bacterium]|nr:hypothetical protein [Anaerohalosphaeraceae bacterium]